MSQKTQERLLKELQAKVERTKQRLTSLESQTANARQRLDSLYSSIDNKAKEYQNNVLTPLKEQKKVLEARVAKLSKQEDAQFIDLENVKLDILKLEETLLELGRAYESAIDEIAGSDVKRNDLLEQINAQTAILNSLKQEEQDYRSRINILAREEDDLQQGNIQLVKDRDNLQTIIEQTTTESEVLKQAKLEELETLEKQKQLSLEALNSTTIKDKTMREAWATEQLKLDKREENLKRREFLVVQSEGKLQDNARLLNL